jgi:molecular chaperone GrpE
MTRDEETPEIEPIDNVDNDDSAEVVEAEVVAETVVDDAFVASVLDESEGDVAASIEWLLAERTDALDGRLRAMAELRNNQRRAEENETRVIRATKAGTVRRMLTVVDQLELALGQNLEGMTAAQFAEGVTLARDEFLRALAEQGVEPIEPSVGDVFEPLQHEAMLKQPADDVESGHVSMVMQPGFAMGETVIRPAKVATAP